MQYVINTHHHFDHAGGLRTYLSQGTTIVTHESNKQYYLDILFHPAPRTLQPDRMALFNPMYWISRRPPPIETVAGEPRSTREVRRHRRRADPGSDQGAGHGLRAGRSLLQRRATTAWTC